MNQMIDLRPYLPPEPPRRPAQRQGASLLVYLEAAISIVMGVSVLIGIAAFLLML